jgi:hypothetical protein
MPDDKKSLADQLRARKQAQEAEEKAQEKASGSLADQLRAKTGPAAEPAKPSLADQLRAKSAPAPEPEKPSLAEQMRARTAPAPAPKPAAPALGKAAGAVIGAALPLAALTPEVAAAVTQKLTSAQNAYKQMFDRVRLTSLVKEAASMGAQVAALPGAVAEVRQRGYAFRSFLEHKAEVLAEQWGAVDGEIKSWIANEAGSLEAELKRVGEQLASVEQQPAGTNRQQQAVEQFNSQIELLDERVKAAENRITALFEDLRRETNTASKQIDEIKWYLTQKDEASFTLLPGEALFMAAQAEWDDGGKKPDGILFLTDQRLIFEQKEKTGKTFGMFGGQQVQQALWEAPVSSVEKVEAENKGFLGGKDMLHFKLGAGAPFAALTLELKGGVRCKEWAQQINRLVRGDARDERAIEPDPELVARLQNAPTECSVCGGMLPQIMRGQTQVECRYCGTVVRL